MKSYKTAPIVKWDPELVHEIVNRRYHKPVCILWFKWFSICSENDFDPLSPGVKIGAIFLAIYFARSNCQYSSIKVALSSLPAVLLLSYRVKFSDKS